MYLSEVARYVLTSIEDYCSNICVLHDRGRVWNQPSRCWCCYNNDHRRNYVLVPHSYPSKSLCGTEKVFFISYSTSGDRQLLDDAQSSIAIGWIACPCHFRVPHASFLQIRTIAHRALSRIAIRTRVGFNPIILLSSFAFLDFPLSFAFLRRNGIRSVHPTMMLCFRVTSPGSIPSGESVGVEHGNKRGEGFLLLQITSTSPSQHPWGTPRPCSRWSINERLFIDWMWVPSRATRYDGPVWPGKRVCATDD